MFSTQLLMWHLFQIDWISIKKRSDQSLFIFLSFLYHCQQFSIITNRYHIYLEKNLFSDNINFR